MAFGVPSLWALICTKYVYIIHTYSETTEFLSLRGGVNKWKHYPKALLWLTHAICTDIEGYNSFPISIVKRISVSSTTMLHSAHTKHTFQRRPFCHGTKWSGTLQRRSSGLDGVRSGTDTTQGESNSLLKILVNVSWKKNSNTFLNI